MEWLEKLAFGIIAGILAITIVAVVGLITAIPLYFLWNWLMPTIFGVKTITFFQALGLNLLAGILFRNSYSSKNSN